MGPSPELFPERPSVNLHSPHYLCEPVLWTATFVHLGTLCAKKESGVLQVSADNFRAVVLISPQHALFTSRYAKEFIDDINAARRSDNVASDLPLRLPNEGSLDGATSFLRSVLSGALSPIQADSSKTIASLR